MPVKRSLLAALVCGALLACGGGQAPPTPEPTQDPKPDAQTPKPDPQTPEIGVQEPAPNSQNPELPAELAGQASGEGGASADDN